MQQGSGMFRSYWIAAVSNGNKQGYFFFASHNKPRLRFLLMELTATASHQTPNQATRPCIIRVFVLTLASKPFTIFTS